MLTSFRQLLLDEMNEEDMKNIASIVEDDPDTTKEFVYSKLSSFEMVPWRLETDKGNTIFLVEVRQQKKDRILFIWFVSGKGLYSAGCGQYVIDTLVEYAKIHNCDAIETLATMSFAHYLKKAGFDMDRCFVRKEVN